MRDRHRVLFTRAVLIVFPAMLLSARIATGQGECPVERRVECTPLGDRMVALLRAVTAEDTAALRSFLPAEDSIAYVPPENGSAFHRRMLSADQAVRELSYGRANPVWSGLRSHAEVNARWRAEGQRFVPAVRAPDATFVEWRREGNQWVVSAVGTGLEWNRAYSLLMPAACPDTGDCGHRGVVFRLRMAILNGDSLDLRTLFPPGQTVRYQVGGIMGDEAWQVSTDLIVAAFTGDSRYIALRAPFEDSDLGTPMDECDSVARYYHPTNDRRPPVVELRLRSGQWVITGLGAAGITGAGRRALEALSVAESAGTGQVRRIVTLRAKTPLRSVEMRPCTPP